MRAGTGAGRQTGFRPSADELPTRVSGFLSEGSVAVLGATTLVRRPAEVTSLSARSVKGTDPEIDPQPSLPPAGGEDHGKAQGGNVVQSTVGFDEAATGTASPLSINPSPTRAPAAKVATPNAPNRKISPKLKVQTGSRGVGKTTGEKPRPRADPISLRFGQVIPSLARIGIFWGRPRGCAVHS